MLSEEALAPADRFAALARIAQSTIGPVALAVRDAVVATAAEAAADSGTTSSSTSVSHELDTLADARRAALYRPAPSSHDSDDDEDAGDASTSDDVKSSLSSSSSMPISGRRGRAMPAADAIALHGATVAAILQGPLHRPLLRLLSDPSARVREAAASLLLALMPAASDLAAMLPFLAPAVLGRAAEPWGYDPKENVFFADREGTKLMWVVCRWEAPGFRCAHRPASV